MMKRPPSVRSDADDEQGGSEGRVIVNLRRVNGGERTDGLGDSLADTWVSVAIRRQSCVKGWPSLLVLLLSSAGQWKVIKWKVNNTRDGDTATIGLAAWMDDNKRSRTNRIKINYTLALMLDGTRPTDLVLHRPWFFSFCSVLLLLLTTF